MEITMAKKTESIWTWLKAKGKIFKVVSNPAKGTIKVYDKKGKLLMKKTNLSKKQVELVEDSFLSFVVSKLNGFDIKHQKEDFDPMVA
jgi:hypothetical protein